ncbi:C-terminal helicase domain-containing protein, partial [Mycobacterium xenopi]
QRGVAHPPVPRHTDGAHEQDQPREQADNHIGKLNDEQDRRGRHPERRSTLVFSQFTGFLGILRSHLDAAGIGYSYMDGSVSARGRAAALAAFGEGANQVFLISLKAGGFGLNLTEADYCFLCDPWWSPAAEAQAVDRAHRIGQTRPVTVYRLVSSGTIEEKVVGLQQRKRELFTAVMDEGELFSSAITVSDVRELLAG